MCAESQYGVVSLLAMLEFAAREYMELSYAFGEFLGARNGKYDEVRFSNAVAKIVQHGSALGLNATLELAIRMSVELGKTNPPEVFQQQVKNMMFAGTMSDERMRFYVEALYASMTAELHALKYAAVPLDRVRYFNEKWLMDMPLMSDKYPTSHKELSRAASCYALGESNACVFHSMRALEPGLDSLARRFSVSFAHESWQNVIDQVESEIRKLGKLKKSPQKVADETFFGDAAQHFYFLKNAWRNHAAHGRESYADKQALKIMEHTGDLIESLGSRLSEV